MYRIIRLPLVIWEKLNYVSTLIGDEKGVIWNLWGRDVCMQKYTYVYMYIYLCFIRSRGTFPFKYRKMLTEIIFEAYIFKVIVHIITREIIVSLRFEYSTNFV